MLLITRGEKPNSIVKVTTVCGRIIMATQGPLRVKVVSVLQQHVAAPTTSKDDKHAAAALLANLSRFTEGDLQPASTFISDGGFLMAYLTSKLQEMGTTAAGTSLGGAAGCHATPAYMLQAVEGLDDVFCWVDPSTGREDMRDFYLDPQLKITREINEMLIIVLFRYRNRLSQPPKIVSGTTKSGKSTVLMRVIPALLHKLTSSVPQQGYPMSGGSRGAQEPAPGINVQPAAPDMLAAGSGSSMQRSGAGAGAAASQPLQGQGKPARKGRARQGQGRSATPQQPEKTPCVFKIDCSTYCRVQGLAGFLFDFLSDLQRQARGFGLAAGNNLQPDAGAGVAIIKRALITFFEALPQDVLSVFLVDEAQFFFLLQKVEVDKASSNRAQDADSGTGSISSKTSSNKAENGTHVPIAALDMVAMFECRSFMKVLLARPDPHLVWVLSGSLTALLWANISEMLTNGTDVLLNSQPIHLPTHAEPEVMAAAWQQLQKRYTALLRKQQETINTIAGSSMPDLLPQELPDFLLAQCPPSPTLLAVICAEWYEKLGAVDPETFVMEVLQEKVYSNTLLDLRLSRMLSNMDTSIVLDLLDPDKGVVFERLHKGIKKMFRDFMKPCGHDPRMSYADLPMYSHLVQAITNEDGTLQQGLSCHLQPDMVSHVKKNVLGNFGNNLGGYTYLDRDSALGKLCVKMAKAITTSLGLEKESSKRVLIDTVVDQPWFKKALNHPRNSKRLEGERTAKEQFLEDVVQPGTANLYIVVAAYHKLCCNLYGLDRIVLELDMLSSYPPCLLPFLVSGEVSAAIKQNAEDWKLAGQNTERKSSLSGQSPPTQRQASTIQQRTTHSPNSHVQQGSDMQLPGTQPLTSGSQLRQASRRRSPTSPVRHASSLDQPHRPQPGHQPRKVKTKAMAPARPSLPTAAWARVHSMQRQAWSRHARLPGILP